MPVLRYIQLERPIMGQIQTLLLTHALTSILHFLLSNYKKKLQISMTTITNSSHNSATYFWLYAKAPVVCDYNNLLAVKSMYCITVLVAIVHCNIAVGPPISRQDIYSAVPLYHAIATSLECYLLFSFDISKLPSAGALLRTVPSVYQWNMHIFRS